MSSLFKFIHSVDENSKYETRFPENILHIAESELFIYYDYLACRFDMGSLVNIMSETNY